MDFGRYARKKKLERINSKTTKITNLVSSTIIKVLIFSIILFGVIGVAGGLGTLKAIIDAAPSIDILLNNITPEGYTTIIYDQNGKELQQLAGADANRIYVEYDQIPVYLGQAFVAIEDERFFDHNGIDLEGIFRAIYTNIKDSRFSNPEGASTITQQIIKNNVLTTDVTFERKLQEMYLATEVEKYLSKEEILELYMNTAACGRGTNGVQTASKLYFNKDVWEISLAESAVLASITNKPGRYDPVNYPENNRERAERILNKLLEQGYISQEEYEVAWNEDVYSQIQINSQLLSESSDYSYFVDEAINRVVDDLAIQKGITETQAFNLLYRGGLSIYITQDLTMQKAMDDVFLNEENYPPQSEDFAVKLMYSLSVNRNGEVENIYHEEQFANEEEADLFIQSIKDEEGLSEQDFIDKTATENKLIILQPQAAMVVMDIHTGHVKAIAGGRGVKKGNNTFNRATQAMRQPGSTFKVLAAYLPALDTGGYTLATVIDDAPISIAMPDGSSYSPGNWYSGYKGLSTVRQGIIDSMNILAVRTVFDIGTDLAFDYLMDLGFTTLHESKIINGKVFTDKTLSLPLGGLTDGVTPLELTAGYSAIANNGVYVEPIFYTKVLDHSGNILLNKEPITRPVMKETTAFLLTSAMIDVVRVGTAPQAAFKEVSMPVAGKTGTTTATKDLWFAGYTPYYAAALWMGYDDPQKMAYVKSYHKYMWRDVMEAIHVGLPYKDFDVPEGITTASICTESGKLAEPGLCSSDPRGSTVRTEYFAQGSAPTETCDIHKEVLICTSSGLFATEYCPSSTVVSKVMIQRPIPLIEQGVSPDKLGAIADYQYEIPYSMIGEYCTVHGPHTEVPVPTPTDPTTPDTPSDSETTDSEPTVPQD
ncbi:MAG: PBP1A family penicillin-binding protein [Vallitaleaceae bacterium]|nr:PBP1A family penicillin-binding protein [Vallitaleaceae bacterium]